LILSDRDSFFARYTFDDAASFDTEESILFRNQAASRQQYATLLGTHIFSLSALTTLRIGFTRPVSLQDTVAAIQIPPAMYFIPGTFKFGTITVPGLSTMGPGNSSPDLRIANSFQYASDTFLKRGAHTLKWGMELHRYRWDADNNNGIGGQWTFNSLESFLQAGPAGTSVIAAQPGSDKYHAYRQTLLGTYLQDSLELHPNLTLNLGLRYEFATLIHDKNGKSSYVADPLHDPAALMGPFFARNPSGKVFAPRLGVAWSAGKRNSSVVNLGFGIFHDEVLRYVLMGRDASAPYYKRGNRVNIDARPYFPNALAAVEGSPYDVRAMDYLHPHVPAVLRYTASLQQQLAGNWRIQATYVGARGNHLFRGYETTQFPFPVRLSDGTLFFPPDLGALNPVFSAGAKISSPDAQSFFNALQLSTGKTFGRGLSFQASYSYSKSVDDASFSGGESQFGYERTINRALSDFDIRQRLSLNYFYSLPAGKGQRSGYSGALARALGGWRVGGIVSLRAGTPITAKVSVVTPRYLYAATQPNLLPGESNNPTSGTSAGCRDPRTQQFIVEPGRSVGGPDLYFDPCSFAVPAPGTIGNVGRNTLIAPNVFNLDVSLQRDFSLDSKRRFQFRAEFFNLPNHANFGKALAGVFSGAFPGRPNPTAGRINTTITTSRQIQFALRFTF